MSKKYKQAPNFLIQAAASEKTWAKFGNPQDLTFEGAAGSKVTIKNVCLPETKPKPKVRRWKIEIRWEPDLFTWKPYGSFSRTRHARGVLGYWGWLSFVVNYNTWKF